VFGMVGIRPAALFETPHSGNGIWSEESRTRNQPFICLELQPGLVGRQRPEEGLHAGLIDHLPSRPSIRVVRPWTLCQGGGPTDR
jgi:hypothetical protein